MPPVRPPKGPVGKTPPPKGPDLSVELIKSVWMGTEDLAGFGKLRARFRRIQKERHGFGELVRLVAY